MGPESRIQPRSVGTRKKSTASRLAPDFFNMLRTRDSASRFSTSKYTRSTFDKCRTISERPGDGSKFSGPVGQFVGPAEPRGFMALPLGGHAETERARGGGIGDRGHEQALRSRRCFNTEFTESTQKSRV